MTDRLTQCLTRLRAEKRTVLCPFITAGYPDMRHLGGMLMALQNAGAGMVELGFPFSDPVADGPVIQESYRLALEKGADIGGILAEVRGARKAGFKLPLLAMISFSILFRYGTPRLAAEAAAAGIDGFILPDVTLEEAPAVIEEIGRHGLAGCLLVAPTTPPARRRAIGALCTGFVYYLSVTGITGERTSLPADLSANLLELRRLTDRPVCVGFGVSTPQQVQALSGLADGVIVGSALIRCITREMAADKPDVVRAVGELAGALSAPLTANNNGC